MIEKAVRLNSIEQVKAFVNITMSKDYDVDLTQGKYIVNGKSIMGIFSLDLTRPLSVVAYCDDNEQFLSEIEGFIYTENAQEEM